MRKHGFTLIELMVVIVIVGILAAIAIPKMFGMSAKAKAAEAGPAAGSWSKLVQTYYGETSSLGNWVSIGYTAPGDKIAGTGKSSTPNFLYEDVDYGTQPATAHWQATAQNISDACKNQVWKVESNGQASTVTAIGCPDLTPNFKNLQ